MLGVDRTVREMAGELDESLDPMVETMLARMAREVPEFALRDELAEPLRASCYGNVRVLLSALGSDREPPGNSPPEAVEEARATARAGVALESLVHTYRVGHAVVWEHLLELAERMKVEPVARHAALSIGSRFLFAYIDAVVSQVTPEYMLARERAVRTRAERRGQLVRDVLAGAPVSAAELGYDLDVEHIAAVAQGGSAESDIRALAHQLERQLLIVPVADQTIWAWLGSRRPQDRDGSMRLTGFSPIAGTRLALGEPAWGADGFRESHVQAVAAQRVGTRFGQSLTRYDDVALEAAVLADESSARRFVGRELGALMNDDERSATLRETLDAYLRTGTNASAAAAMLGVTDRTVAYRVRAIEEALGRTVLSRSCELAAALRLGRLYI